MRYIPIVSYRNLHMHMLTITVLYLALECISREIDEGIVKKEDSKRGAVCCNEFNLVIFIFSAVCLQLL